MSNGNIKQAPKIETAKVETKAENQHRTGLVKDLNAGGDSRVNFNIYLEDLQYFSGFYKRKFGKVLNPETVTVTEVREMILHNDCWDIPKQAKSSTLTIKRKALLKAMTEEEIDKLLKQKNILI